MVMLGSFSSFAQDRKVSGKVSGPDGQGIPGVSILVKGTSTGTTTDVNGSFSVNVKSGSSVLTVSAVGYKSKDVSVGSQSSVAVTLDEDVSQLSEVVVTGYTIDNRRETTGAVSIVKATDLTIRPSGNVEQQLQGRVAGVTVITNGQPGTTSQVRIRGFGSFGPAGSNDPLYIVDGLPVPSTDFINPDDIENVTVLKDAAAASIYGARAANGVIVYTTKKGTKSAKKLNVSYDAMYGVTDPGTGQAMMNPTDFATWTWNGLKNSGITPSHPQFGNGATPVIPEYINVGGAAGQSTVPADWKSKYNIDPTAGAIYQVVRANKTGTDWYKAITRSAPIHRHSLGFSGGGENSRYYLGLGIQDQQGILMSNSFKRYSFRANSEFNVLKNLRIGENMQITYRQALGQTGGAGGQGIAQDENDILQAFRMPSIIPVYDENGGYAGTAAKGFNNPRNPVANQTGLLNNRSFTGSAVGNVYAEWDIIEGLTARTSVGGQYSNQYNWSYSRLQYENSENNSAFGYNEGAGYSFAYTFTNTLNYKKKFGKHNVDVLVGQEALNTGAGRSMSAGGFNPFSIDPNYITMSTVAGSGKTVNSNQFAGVNFASVFGRVNYMFDNKYILTAVVRRDGSSRFGANSRYGIFPAFSAAWRVSSEDFMKDLTWVNDLKIRGGYGTMGNSNPVDPNNQYSLFSTNIGRSVYDINGSNSSVAEGYYRTRVGNPDAKWETAITKNIGFDGTFLNGRLDVIVDFWQKDTKDLLLALPIPATNGFDAAAPSVNIGSMVNKGLDIAVNTKGKITSDLDYDLGVTAGFLKNEITGIADGLTYISTINPGYRGLQPIRNQLGYSISSFYGYKVQGLFQSAAEAASAPKQDGAAAGRFRYVDVNGDNKIDANDRTYLGSPVPTFTAGLTFRLSYKNFDLVSQANGFFGNKIFNASKWFTDFFPSFQGAAISERVKDSWTPSNTGATIPIFETASNFSTNTQANSFYVENGDYIRLQTVTLGYTMPQSILSKLKMNKLRVFASANNLFTITKYQGLDPGVGGNADTQFGIDVGNYPITKSYTVGLNIGF
jgi:TonB-linked SusC/RagA family outer membrane protein